MSGFLFQTLDPNAAGGSRYTSSHIMTVFVMISAAVACSFGHAFNLLLKARFLPSNCAGKLGKKLTNNFIILCELGRERRFGSFT
jgi:hypothetical protein